MPISSTVIGKLGGGGGAQWQNVVSSSYTCPYNKRAFVHAQCYSGGSVLRFSGGGYQGLNLTLQTEGDYYESLHPCLLYTSDAADE